MFVIPTNNSSIFNSFSSMQCFFGAVQEWFKITLPQTLTSIEDSLFQNCTSLQRIEIPPSVTTIGKKSFFSYTSLQQIFIPLLVAIIGEAAFQKCASLDNVTFANPSSLIEIGKYAFKECSSLVQFIVQSCCIMCFRWLPFPQADFKHYDNWN